MYMCVLRRSFCFFALHTDSSQLHTLFQINHWRAFWTKYCLVVILTECKLFKMEHARKKRNKRIRMWWLSPVVGSSHQNRVNNNTLSHVWDLSLNKKTVLTFFFSLEGPATEKYAEPVKVETTEVKFIASMLHCKWHRFLLAAEAGFVL